MLIINHICVKLLLSEGVQVCNMYIGYTLKTSPFLVNLLAECLLSGYNICGSKSEEF